jgi:hypothetical protein
LILKKFNPHYNFIEPINLAEIDKQDGFDAEGALLKMEPYKSGGGSIIPSPWGSNQSVDAGKANTETVSKYLETYGFNFAKLLNPTGEMSTAEPTEFCIKDLVVKPGNQLSLQRHRGREEYWIVKYLH